MPVMKYEMKNVIAIIVVIIVCSLFLCKYVGIYIK